MAVIGCAGFKAGPDPGSYELEGSAAPFRFTTIGQYLVVEINNGIVIIWNCKTILFIKIRQSYKGCVCGLCGNFDGNANNDQTTCCGAMEVDPLVFGNSWKDSPDCPDVPHIPNPCVSNPYRHPWSYTQCNFIHSSVFSTCHLAVDPLPYYDACVFDTCSCEPKGDCDILCTAVAAYAEACNQAGICVDWRTPNSAVSIVCDFNKPSAASEWHYKPCGDPCMKTCRNPSGICSNDIPPLEGKHSGHSQSTVCY
uniref:VWFD domain-containing protein n=1 Tax=Neogobius melanostomus TaxID=47308 RepID=A0A8C6SHF3_9GOBI